MPKLVEIESQAPILNELERCVQWAYKQFAGDRVELPAVTISIQTRGKKATLCGVFRADSFHTKEGAPVHEIVVTSEHLFEDPYRVLGTVVHETVHLFNRDIGETDCSKNGQHNKIFRDAALQWGLDVADKVDAKGWYLTDVGADLRKLIENNFKPDESVFRIFKEQEEVKEKKDPVKKIRPWTCECPITLQVAVGVELNAKCDVCVSDFKLKK